MAQTHTSDDAPARVRTREIDAPALEDHRDAPAHPDVDVNRPRVLADHEVNPRLVDAAPRPSDLHLIARSAMVVDPETGRPLPPPAADPDPRYPSPAHAHARLAHARRLKAAADAELADAEGAAAQHPAPPTSEADLPAHARR